MRKATALALLNALIDEGVLLPDKKAAERGFAYWRADPDMLPADAKPGIAPKRAAPAIALSPDGVFLGLTPTWFEKAGAAFPGLNVLAEVTRAEKWCEANPKRAPRSRAAAFLNSWLAKAHAKVTKAPGRDQGRNAAAATMVGE